MLTAGTVIQSLRKQLRPSFEFISVDSKVDFSQYEQKLQRFLSSAKKTMRKTIFVKGGGVGFVDGTGFVSLSNAKKVPGL